MKVGIGPGSVCTTRMVTGVGYPQLSAISECAQAAHGLRAENKRLGLICGDGGCKTSGDVCKAFAGGADFVMLGGMFAGVDECDGEWQYRTELTEYKTPDGYTAWSPKDTSEKSTLKFYGMSSHHAQEKHNGGIKDYRASEGEVRYVKYKGPASKVIQKILGGIRSSCSLIGAQSIKDMNKCGQFCKVNSIK